MCKNFNLCAYGGPLMHKYSLEIKRSTRRAVHDVASCRNGFCPKIKCQPYIRDHTPSSFQKSPIQYDADLAFLSRSVNVSDVDYACTVEEVQQHFQSCGTINRPKGFAFVEFHEVEAVQEALLLNEPELHGRQLKVLTKRTNAPGMKQYRPRHFNPYMGYRSRRPYAPSYFYSPYGYG
ncbi:hypothetical protein K2173_012717 [Erythroxylum novogranatense]|uniref:RRM domain-containing protein n=1 Tax=Erythroxylum novogranatense TaxID=1862640 RepID=A0AAV8U542_9ROSI|nr:hypothetical protein K2173_012717 [Erythroxylum novogranatense]